MKHKDFAFMNELLPLDERVNDLLQRLTLEEKIRLIPTKQAAVPRLGIKEYTIGGEAAHGVAWLGKATVFPQPIGLASSWDMELMAQIGQVIGDEYRVYYQKSGCTKGLSIWFPTVDMERDPRWGRNEEAYGEDPFLTGKMAGTLVQSLQGDHPFYLRAAATLKHFFANNNERNRTRCSISVDPRNMREYYWEPFRRIITEFGAKCIMTAYNQVNGRPMMVNPIVQKVVKEQWGLDGFVVCDGGAFSQIVNHHQYYKTHAETAAFALKHGVDSLTDEPELVVHSIEEALEEGLIAERDIDKALWNIFRTRFRYGHFSSSKNNPYPHIPETALCSAKHSEIAYKAAQKAIVLLKNDENLLPLKKEKKKIAIIGPMGNKLYNDWYSGTYPYHVTIVDGLRNKLPDATIQYIECSDTIRIKSVATGKYLKPDDKGVLYANGEQASKKCLFRMMDWGWGSFTLQSLSNDQFITCDNKLSVSAEAAFGWFVKEVFNLIPQGCNQCIIKTWNGNVVTLAPDGSLMEVEKAVQGEEEHFVVETVQKGMDEAASAAKNAELVLATLGNNPVINGKEEVDRPAITLPSMQEKLLKTVYAENKNTVLILVSAYPVAINWAQEEIPAILHTAHGGQEMGHAIADVLFGDYNPAGRLPMTWVQSEEHLPPMMDYDIIKGNRTYLYFDKKPLYPFGFGLSYSKFAYENLRMNGETINKNADLEICVDIINKGPYDGEEVVQLYTRLNGSRVKRPQKQLKGFERVALAVGERKTVYFGFNAAELSFWDVTREIFCLETGSCTIMVGPSSTDIRLKQTLLVNGETIPPRNLTDKTWAENYDDYKNITLGEYCDTRSCIEAQGTGSWIVFRKVDFSSDPEIIKARVACKGAEAGVEIRLDSADGEIIGFFHIPNTDTLAVPDWKTVPAWATVECAIEQVRGVHDVYIIFKEKAALSWLQMA